MWFCRLAKNANVPSVALKVVGDTALDEPQEAPEVTYELMCRRHWHAGLREMQGDQLELLDAADSPVIALEAPSSVV